MYTNFYKKLQKITLQIFNQKVLKNYIKANRVYVDIRSQQNIHLLFVLLGL